MLFSKGIALGFDTLCFDAERRGIKPSARMKTDSAILIGTSGYNYPEWKGVFYPTELIGKVLQLLKKAV